jgi:hypothetical protein
MRKRKRQTPPASSSSADKLISEAMAELARRRAAAQTPEERTMRARHAVKQRWKKAGAEGRAAIGRMLAEARKKAAKAAETGQPVRRRRKRVRPKPEAE